MPSSPPVVSIAACADTIGARVAGHLDHLWRLAMQPQGGVADADWFRLISGEPHPLGNVAILAWDDHDEAAIAAVTPLLAIAEPSAVICLHGASEHLAGVLSARGFQAHGAMPAMAVDIGALAPTSLPPGHTFQRIVADRRFREWTDVVASGYELPRDLARMLSPEALGADATDNAAIQFFAILEGDRIVATSMMFLDDGLAGLYCVATLADARGRGLGTHVTAEPLRRAQALGYRVGALQSSDAGYTVYRRLGFRDVGAVPLFVRMPAG
ncbi:GNAT family N-acetyltransferase [Pseudoxanthomonas sp. LjRoot143]|uniref:GNAT family N-acetyltransferase n=1 Tax=Pseudoxanthomonas sp. LjRoot143 TaxID=3342266 RepID=UPI003ECFBF4C